MWPGRIPAGVVSHTTVSTLDFLPTIAALAGVPLPADRDYDGVDIAAVLFAGAPNTTRDYLFHPDTMTGNVTGVRHRNYKALFESFGAPGCGHASTPNVRHSPPLIFDLDADPGETAPLSPPPSGVVEGFEAAFAAKWVSIRSGMRSHTNYSGGGHAAWPCCDASRVACRCMD